MSDRSDIEDTDNTLKYPVSDTDQTGGNDDMQQQQEDDDEFGSFDDAVEDDDFGDFEEEEEEDIDNTPIFNTIQDAMDLWHHLLDQIYHYEALDSFTGNAPKSIKQYVLEEAPESLHSRLTWDSVTRYMETDTGTPKVKWHQSEIERHHLNALACKRSATPAIASAPTMLDTTAITQEPQPMMDIKPALDTVIGSNAAIVDQQPTPNSSSASTTSEKRSSVFGLSSLSRFLPHLSRSNLPKSPTTSTAPTSPITASSQSSPRQHSATVNHLNVSPPVKQQQDIKRSNSVAFTSTRTHTTKPRPTSSFQPSQSMDLFDLTDDPTTIVRSPTQLQFNLEPLVPTHALSPTPVRRNTIPANMHSDIQPTKSTTPHVDAFLDTIQDDEFGDFTTEVKQGHDDFSQEKPAVPWKPDAWMGSSTMTGSKKPLDKDDDDPYGIASYAPQSVIASPKAMTSATFDLLAPIASGLTSQPNTTATPHWSHSSADTCKTTSDQKQPKSDAADDENDEWGDWAF